MENILKILEKLFDIKEIPTRFVGVICVCSALILLLPEHLLTKLYLNEFFEEYGKYAGIVFIVSFVFLLIVMICFIISIIYKNILRKRKIAYKNILRQQKIMHENTLRKQKIMHENTLRQQREEGIIKAIQHLNYHEKALLREFFIHEKNTMQIPMDDDTVIGLVNKHVICQASNMVSTYFYCTYLTYSITETAQENLTYDMVDLPKNPTEADREWVTNHRPQWAKNRSKAEYLLNSY